MLLTILLVYVGIGAFIGVVTTFISMRDPEHRARYEGALASLPPDMYWTIVYIASAAVSGVFWPFSFPMWIKNSFTKTR